MSFILMKISIKNSIFRSEFWSCQWQKWYRNPFSGHFETPKEYWRHCHIYLGKVKFFGGDLDQKSCQKCDFSSGGGALNALPPYGRVNKNTIHIFILKEKEHLKTLTFNLRLTNLLLTLKSLKVSVQRVLKLNVTNFLSFASLGVPRF